MASFLNFSGDYSGLNSAEVDERLGMYGFNSETKLEEDGKGFRPASVFLSGRFILMLVSSAMLIVGENLTAGIILLLLTVFYCVSEIYKGIKSDETLHDFKRSTAMKYRVVRDGQLTLLRREYLVPDDIIILQGGENVPVDAHILELKDLLVDESLFTEDKSPVGKIVGSDSKNEIKQSMIYRGTRIMAGSLVARVTETGVDTKKYKMFGAEPVEEFYFTAFEKAINRTMHIFTAIAGIMFIVGGFLGITAFTADSTSTVFELISSLVTTAGGFALCFIPAETASLVRIYYLFGAKKLAAQHSMVKDLNAIESLNSLTAICIDKSGTVTTNSIEVEDEYSKNPEMLSNVAILACDVTPSSPFDRAIIVRAAFTRTDVKDLQQNELLRDYPLSHQFKITGKLWNVNGSRLLCIKGSPENVFTLCDIDPEQLYTIQKQQSTYAAAGNQIIACAYALLDEDEEIPAYLSDKRYSFVGLIAFSNRTRDTIPVAIRSCYKAGVKVIMTTGDGTETALAVGRKIGLKQGKVVTGEQLRSAAEYGEKIDLTDVNIFSRISPDQKKEIVRLLQEQGEIVALTGDDTTDAEVLEQADVGITMSQYTTGAAYEASDVIMNDDNFNSIVETLKTSRQLHKNIKRSISLVISSTLAMAIYAIFNLFLGGHVISPIFASLVTVLLVPFGAMLFLNNNADIKSELASSGFIGRGVVNRSFIYKAIISGLTMTAAMLIFGAALGGNADGVVRSGMLSVFIGAILSLAWSAMSDKLSIMKSIAKASPMAMIISGAMLLFTLLIIYMPFVNEIFGLEMLNPFIFIIGLLLGIVSEIWHDIIKLLKKNKSE